METLFIQKYPSSNSGGSSTVRVFTKFAFITGGITNSIGITVKSRNNIQYARYGNFSRSICQMTVREFEYIFNKIEIKEMQLNGMLDYDSTADLNRYRGIHKKYPMFSAKIYKKYGIDISVMEEENNESRNIKQRRM